MGKIHQVLLNKVDLDTIATAWLMVGCAQAQPRFTALRGSANAAQLADPTILCVEVGGSGRMVENNFDHHDQRQPGLLSSTMQVMARKMRIAAYVDAVDRGLEMGRHEGDTFPSLLQLISGMLLSAEKPEEQMAAGGEILQAVLETGIDPYGSMAPLYEVIPAARSWADRKRQHDRLFEEVAASAAWYTTAAGKKLAVVETTWVGAPGALYGRGADIVLARNPAFQSGGEVYAKYTLAAHREAGVTITPALFELQKLEEGWGGPAHGTICGSPMGRDSTLTVEEVTQVIIQNL